MKLTSIVHPALATFLMACGQPEAAAPVPKPSTSSATAGASPATFVECRAKAGPSTLEARFEFATMTGTVMVDGTETRRFAVTAVPHAATYALVFASYGEGDKPPVGEKLVASKSIVTRIVANGEKNDIYFDGDIHPAGTDKTAALHCDP